LAPPESSPMLMRVPRHFRPPAVNSYSTAGSVVTVVASPANWW